MECCSPVEAAFAVVKLARARGLSAGIIVKAVCGCPEGFEKVKEAIIAGSIQGIAIKEYDRLQAALRLLSVKWDRDLLGLIAEHLASVAGVEKYEIVEKPGAGARIVLRLGYDDVYIWRVGKLVVEDGKYGLVKTVGYSLEWVEDAVKIIVEAARFAHTVKKWARPTRTTLLFALERDGPTEYIVVKACNGRRCQTDKAPVSAWAEHVERIVRMVAGLESEASSRVAEPA